MAGAPGSRGVERTILFADIAGSTRLISEIGDDAARPVLERHLVAMGDVVRALGGVELERIGDEILCSFEHPDAAAEASGSLLREVARISALHPETRPFRLRIGFAHGSVVETSQTPFGATVNLAARITALAKPGQILTVLPTLELLEPRRRVLSRLYDRCVLKGIPGEQDIYELFENVDVTIGPGRAPRRARELQIQAVVLRFQGKSIRVDATSPRAELGRDPACDLVLSGESVSRIHAIVEWNHGQVRVEDVSTNGTQVEPDHDGVFPLRREAMALVGRGNLRFGIDLHASTVALVAYVCIEEALRG